MLFIVFCHYLLYILVKLSLFFSYYATKIGIKAETKKGKVLKLYPKFLIFNANNCISNDGC